MHPNLRIPHNPEIRDAVPPASLDVMDGRATGVITRQLERLQNLIGRPDAYKLPSGEPMNGYEFNLENGTAVKLELERDANGNIVAEDQQFLDARNRLAVLRSRERSRGSRLFNFAFRKNRGAGPGGHGYNNEGIAGIQGQYEHQLSEFIARKVTANTDLDNGALTREAVGRAIVQEQRQMSALERMAAETKSGRIGLIDFFRNNKTARIVAGLTLTGVAVGSMALGQLEIALPAMALRTAMSAEGGYLLGRTGWDAFQGWRARRLPNEDIRMASGNDGDFSGRLTDPTNPNNPQASFERFIKINGAEARAGSGDERRQRLAPLLGSRIVYQHYADSLGLAGNFAPNQNDLRDAVRNLYDGTITPVENERLKSDQTQSRRRHIAGVVGAVVFGALPATRVFGLVGDVFSSHGSHAADTVASHGGPHHVSPNAPHQPGHPGTTNPNNTPSNPSGPAHPANPNAPVSPDTTATTPGTTETAPGTPLIVINGGPGNDTLVLGGHETAHHVASNGIEHTRHATHGASHAVQHINGELHVKAGGGFIGTFEDQYHMNDAQAEAAYRAMHDQLLGAHGTYTYGSDIRISAPGDFKLPAHARAILEHRLAHLHKLPEHLRHVADHTVHHAAANGGTTAPDKAPSHPHPQTGGISAPLPTGADPATAAQLAHHHDMLMPNQIAPETDMQALTPAEAAKAQAYIGVYARDGGFPHIPLSARAAANHVIENYIQASVDRPVSGAYAHQALERLHQTWMSIGHDLDNMTGDQAGELNQDLAIVNAG